MTAHDAFVALAAVGGLLLVLGILSGLIHEKGILSEPLLALLAGVLIGPAALGLLDLAHFGDLQRTLEYAALLTLGVALVGVALRLPEWYSLRNGRLLTVSLALSLCVLGVAELLGTSAVLAAFVAGVAFNATGGGAKERQEGVQEAITRFFDLPVFVLLGMALPWEGWLELGWGGLLLALSVLVLRRIPAALLLRPLLGPLRRTKDVLFLGWFGPIGAAALYYSTHSLRETGVEEFWTVGSLVIVASVVAHGVTDTPLTKLYGRFPRGEPEEERIRTRA